VKKLILSIFILTQLFALSRAMAQVDPHFSQYYAYPLWLNPALTGVFDGDTRLNTNFKDQWAGISNGYRTGGLSADFRPTEKVGLGLNILNQAAGTAGYNYFTLYGSFGYGIAVSADGTKKLHFGVQAGFINRSFDPSKLQLDDQYNPLLGFDLGLPGLENFTTTNATVFDASAGVFFYDSDPSNAANVFGGFSISHLTTPKDPFAGGALASRLPTRYTIHGGVKIKASDIFDVTPNFIYVRQQQNQLTAIDIYSELKMQDDYGLILGGMYRFKDAAVADVGYHIKNLVIGLSYDFTTSPLSVATNGRGGFELSLNYIFSKKPANPNEVCPRF